MNIRLHALIRRWAILPCGLLVMAAARSAPRPVDGQVVASLVMEAPFQTDFLLRATVPVPRHTWNDGDVGSPVSVVSESGEVFPTQVEIVSRYAAHEADGADVLEVLAQVHRPAGKHKGDEIRYSVVLQPQAPQPLHLHPEVQALLDTSGALSLESSDIFGHSYTARLQGGIDLGSRKHGALLEESTRHVILRPVQHVGGAEGTLPHLMGIHSHLRVMNDAGYLLLDLHVHNGLDGLNKASHDDDALLQIYFQDLGLLVPPGWKVLHAFDNPATGPPQSSGPFLKHPLLDRQPDHTMYYMPKQAHFVRRLAIALPEWEEQARADLDSQYLAFCERGANALGDQLWSWWNPATARWFPQRFPLPSLDHVGLDSVRQLLEDRLAQVEAQIRSGSEGKFPFFSNRLGWAHPWGVGYGGMTGGDEIVPLDGIEVVSAASQAGHRLAQARMRAYVDRHPTALYSGLGHPTRVEDLLVDGPNGPYVTALFYLLPQVGDPFGFADAPQFQTLAVKEKERDPRWEWKLSTYAPIDFQHHIRYTRNLKLLVWLSNDTLAHWELRTVAEQFRLSYHQYPYSQYYGVQDGGLLDTMQWVQSHPGQGLPVGRGEAWGLDALVSSYATGDTKYRAQILPYLESISDTWEAGQSTCTGNLMAAPIFRALGGRYRVRRSNECAYLENALWGLRESVYMGPDPQRTAKVGAMILASIRAGMSAPFWTDEKSGPWLTVGAAPMPEEFDEFCDQVPDTANEGTVDHIHVWSPLGYAYLLSGGDTFFLDRAQQMIETQEPLGNWLHESGLEWLGDRAVLLWVLQTTGWTQ